MYGPDLSIGATPAVLHLWAQGSYETQKHSTDWASKPRTLDREFSFGCKIFLPTQNPEIPLVVTEEKSQTTDNLTKQTWKLTSSISLLAFGEVASLNSLIATGILTFSPSGIQSPYQKEVERVTQSHIYQVNSHNYIHLLHLLRGLKYSEQWEDMAGNKNRQKKSCGC